MLLITHFSITGNQLFGIEWVYSVYSIAHFEFLYNLITLRNRVNFTLINLYDIPNISITCQGGNWLHYEIPVSSINIYLEAHNILNICLQSNINYKPKMYYCISMHWWMHQYIAAFHLHGNQYKHIQIGFHCNYFFKCIVLPLP